MTGSGGSGVSRGRIALCCVYLRYIHYLRAGNYENAFRCSQLGSRVGERTRAGRTGERGRRSARLEGDSEKVTVLISPLSGENSLARKQVGNSEARKSYMRSNDSHKPWR